MSQNIAIAAAASSSVAATDGVSQTAMPFKLMRKSSFMLADSAPASSQSRAKQSFGSLQRRYSAKNNTASASSVSRCQSVNTTEPNSFRSSDHVDETSPLLGPTARRAYVNHVKSRIQHLRKTLNSSTSRNIIKSSIAYLIASLAVYTPVGRVLFGHSDNKHMIATVVVYFHPARTAGSMTEAIIFVFYSLLYSLITASTCMVLSVLLISYDLRWLSYLMSLVIFCGAGLGVIAYEKRRVNLPTFNTACSLASVFLVSVLVREGNIQAGRWGWTRFVRSYMLVVSGCLISTFVCFTLWPQTAESELKKVLCRSLDCDADMLEYISERYLDGTDVETSEFEKLQKDSSSTFTQLDKHLNDARKELYLRGREKEFQLLERLVESDHRLALHLGGLTSSAKIQWHLLAQDDEDDIDSSFLDYYEEQRKNNGSSAISDESDTRQMFDMFAEHLGPPIRSFYITLRSVLDQLPFKNDDINEVADVAALKSRLDLSLDLYSHAREDALQKLYSQDTFRTEQEDIESSADAEGLAASCGNFSYVLEDYANELKLFLEALSEYQELISAPYSKSYSWFSLKRSGGFLSGRQDVEAATSKALRRVETGIRSSDQRSTLGLRVWHSLRAFRRTDVQFGIKVGLGALIFAIPAFLQSTRDIFTLWRGEWGLTIYCIIMNKSLGGTATTVVDRFVGTFIGAAVAYISWKLFPENQYVLAFIGWIMSIICFNIILTWSTRGPFGRFILLTFNLVALYSYSLSVADDDNDDDEGGVSPIVGEIAFHRFISVVAGVIWALIISTCVWPNSARKRLRKHLSTLWLRMGLVWKADAIKTYSLVVTGNTDVRFSGISGENYLHKSMIELQTLLKEAPSELRLKGPFPVAEYKKLLSSTQSILDAYQNISVLISKYPKPSSRELELLQYTSEERQELCSRIFLLFFLASSAMRLGFPLPDKLPSTDHALDRMLVKLNDYRSECIRKTRNSDEPIDEEDFVLFYTYILVTVTITEELSKISQVVQELFGIVEDEMFQVD